jgi:hypothetical protein
LWFTDPKTDVFKVAHPKTALVGINETMALVAEVHGGFAIGDFNDEYTIL